MIKALIAGGIAGVVPYLCGVSMYSTEWIALVSVSAFSYLVGLSDNPSPKRSTSHGN